ncbi:MAG: pobA 2 [Chloroflexi bacterium]|nr:pobA 2 [Chloroflexota bacterium]
MATFDFKDIEHTGPGTLAGRYLRMHWQPVLRAQDLPAGRAKPIRIMGEDLTLYRGQANPHPSPLPGGAGSKPHLLAFRCAHRGTQLSTGWVEGDDLRCFYHGWKYDGNGQCIEQPAEPEPFCNRIKIRSYPTEEYLGLIFVYLGEGEAPPLRRFPDFERDGVLETGTPEYWPCNYFNRIDNAADSAHLMFTHYTSMSRNNRAPRWAAPQISAEETEFGVCQTVVSPGRSPHQTFFHMPNINQIRSSSRVQGSREDAANMWHDRLFWRLPVDDENSVSFLVDFLHLTGEAADAYLARRHQAAEESDPDEGERCLSGETSIRDLDDRTAIYDMFWIEDYVAQTGQGRIATRTAEHSGRSDTGVMFIRKLWERELQRVANGEPIKHWYEPAGMTDRLAIPV